MSARAAALRRLAVAAWLLLLLSVAAWPFVAPIGRLPWALAFVPLLLPLPALLAGSTRALRAATLALTPLLVIAVTEYLVSESARLPAGLSLGLAFAAFAVIVAALRAAAPH
ncbi:MAG: DUF2069 domain-containing protein [Gammaproteobacteria bacterium]|nr:DUF2069 domain-containing protein [Gammaproteobacteria bacterium]